jgi:hypothetical protein
MLLWMLIWSSTWFKDFWLHGGLNFWLHEDLDFWIIFSICFILKIQETINFLCTIEKYFPMLINLHRKDKHDFLRKKFLLDFC